MCSCSPVTTEIPEPTVRFSVHEWGVREAQCHKWIASEKAGHDLGVTAIRAWVRDHWNGFLRARWLEHLEGSKFWIELDHDDYGLLLRAFRESSLIDDILHQLKARKENLDIINWAIDAGRSLPEVHEILVALDINSRRIECLVETRLSQAQAG